jgi:hypothetical protein
MLYLPLGFGDEDTDVDDEDCHPDPLQDSYSRHTNISLILED